MIKMKRTRLSGVSGGNFKMTPSTAMKVQGRSAPGKTSRKPKMRFNLREKSLPLDLMSLPRTELSDFGSAQVNGAGLPALSCRGDSCTGWEVGLKDLSGCSASSPLT